MSHAYPRPGLERANWTSLNGTWEFCIDTDMTGKCPEQPPFDTRILVPFSPETPASGIGNTGLFPACWYRRKFEPIQLEAGDRILLHFGAVDYIAQVWVNSKLAVTHEGGYTPFSTDITDLLRHDGPQMLVVRAQDDPADLSKPR